jgi:hypothetical protein
METHLSAFPLLLFSIMCCIFKVITIIFGTERSISKMQKTNALMVMVIFEWEKMFFMVKHFEI